MENGTGVYYQAMPAVGPNGKNIMKLIPVQKVNGQFVRTQVHGAKNDTQAKVCSQLAHISCESSAQNKLPTLQAIGDGRYILRTPSVSNTLVNSGESHQQGAKDVFKKPIKQVQVSQSAPKSAANALQPPLGNENNNVAVINSPQLPVNVNSSVFPGHYLQIPPNATVRTLPASALPQFIKKRICNSANVPPNPVKGSPTVIYVSPVNSLKLGSNQQLPCLTKSSELSQTLSYSPTTSSGESQNTSSASNSKTTQGDTTPMKWVVQEGTGCTAPYLIPVTSPSVTSDILKVVKQMEAERLAKAAKEPTSTTSQEKVHPGKDNALVMYNGKVYFVAKKDSEISKDVITGAGNRPNKRKSAQPSCTTVGTSTSNKAQKKVSKPANEIIDLCGEDEEGSTCTRPDRRLGLSEAEVQNDDDSNVIFVSYRPPKSEPEASLKIPEAAPETPQSSCGKGVNSPAGDAVNMAVDVQKSSTLVTGTNLNLECQDVLENVQQRVSVSPQPKVICGQGTDVTDGDSARLCTLDTEAVTEGSLKKPASGQIFQRKSDSELRQIFGITSDVRICLQRTNLTREADPQGQRRSMNKRTLEGIRRFIHQAQTETKAKRLVQTQVSTPKLAEGSGPKNGKRQKLEQHGCSSSDSTAFVITHSSPHPSSPVDYEEDKQLVPSANDEVSQTCQQKGTCSRAGACEIAYQTTESLGSSSSSSSSSSATSYVSSGARPPVSRKTPARVSKGSGRVCTACPCGTKVGAVSAIPSPKPAPPAAVDSSTEAVVVSELSADCPRGEKVVESPISSSQDSSGVSDQAGDGVHSSQVYLGAVLSDGTGASQNATSRVEGASQPDLSLKEMTCSRTSGAVTGCETFAQGSEDQLKTAPQQTCTPKKGEGAVPSSSAGQANDAGDGFSTTFLASLLLDPEEIKRQERIRRLKNILREKEAALQKLRQNM